MNLNLVHRWSMITGITFKRRNLKGKGHVTSLTRCLPISREQNVIETPKLVVMLYTPQAIKRTNFKVKGQGHQAN